MANEWHSVVLTRGDSTSIEWISYDHQAKVLRVHFRTGSTWEYSNVYPGEFGMLAAAYSVGRVFNERIRDRYDARRLSPAAPEKQVAASKGSHGEVQEEKAQQKAL